MSTPALNLETSFVLNRDGRIVSTREPHASSGPLFSFVRSARACAWAVRADVVTDIALEIDRLAREEPPSSELSAPPVYADRYVSLLSARGGAERAVAAPIQRSG